MATPRNRRAFLLGGILLLLLALAGALVGTGALGGGDQEDQTATGGDPMALYLDSTGVLGDADGDGEVSEDEAVDLATTETSARKITKTALPTKGVNTLLVTPAGEEWWRFVTGMSAQTATWQSSPPEGGAQWYAYTEGRAYDPVGFKQRPYDAIHVAFGSAAEAYAWVEARAADGTIGIANTPVRGNVLTILPSWVDPSVEPYPDVDEGALLDIKVPIAMWQIDLDEHIGLRAEESVLPMEYLKAWKHLGFSQTNSSWAATSPAPNAIWRGNVSGFDSAKVDTSDFLAALNVSYAACVGLTLDTCGGGQGLGEAVNMVWVTEGGVDGGGGEPAIAPEYLPGDAVVSITMDAGWRGAVTGQFGFNLSPISTISMWVTPDGLLAIHPVLSEDGSDSAASTSQDAS